MSEFISVLIKNPEVERNSGTSRNTGKPYDIRFQRAQLEMPNGELRNVELQHEDKAEDKDALPVGRYQPKRSAVYLDQKGKLVISLRARSWEAVPAKAATPGTVGGKA